ncbi:leukosialin-like [Protopterus annectens]|uniref:leukosialin-like n=1 Tax=Protopterus annectens TaxID=7888 RepID=UPI001CF98554|nr:leukosialin-like [Protopterus annectens]XP_043943857.1 leukosialin-like [Protopterus annectens]XP_043943858.1 leukosialin-like [Protopterus annectens]
MGGKKILTVMVCLTVLSGSLVSSTDKDPAVSVYTVSVHNSDESSTPILITKETTTSIYRPKDNETEAAKDKIDLGKTTDGDTSSVTRSKIQSGKVLSTEETSITNLVTFTMTETTESQQTIKGYSNLTTFTISDTTNNKDHSSTESTSEAISAESLTAQKINPAGADVMPINETSWTLPHDVTLQENVTFSTISSTKHLQSTIPSVVKTVDSTTASKTTTSLASADKAMTMVSELSSVDEANSYSDITTSMKIISKETAEPASTSTDVVTSSTMISSAFDNRTSIGNNYIMWVCIIVAILIFLCIIIIIIICIWRKKKQSGFQSFTSSQKKKKKRPCEDAWAGPVPMPDDTFVPNEAVTGKGTDVPTKHLSLTTFFAKRKSRSCSVVLEEVNTQNVSDEKEKSGNATSQPLLPQNATDNVQGNSASIQSNGQVNKEAANANKDIAVPLDNAQGSVSQANGQVPLPMTESANVSGENLEELPPPPAPTPASETDSLLPPPPVEDNINQNASSSFCLTASL